MLQKTGEFETKGGCFGFAIGLDSGAVAAGLEPMETMAEGVGEPGAKLAAEAVSPASAWTVGAGGAGQGNPSAVAPVSLVSLRSVQGKLSPAIFSAEDSAATARSERREGKVEGQGFSLGSPAAA